MYNVKRYKNSNIQGDYNGREHENFERSRVSKRSNAG
jgi:hypothetical protein